MLEVKNLHKNYHNGSKTIRVLKGLNLNIEKGQIIAIVGPSGAGKSTLLHILGGLDSPSEGKVIFEQRDIYRLSDAELSQLRNKKIGFVFQFYHLLSEFSVLENILLPARISGNAPFTKVREIAFKLLEKTGLGERTGHFPSQLSGGERQRVAILRGLINNPEMLLCDEPTGNLDSASGEEVMALIRKINSQNKTAVILVTHNLELAKSADRVYHLRDGVLAN